MDAVLLEFVSKNFLTIGLVVMFLKGLAQVTPWTWDEKVVDLISAMFTTLQADRPRKAVKPVDNADSSDKV